MNELCKVASCRKHIKRNMLTMHGPLNIKLVSPPYTRHSAILHWQTQICGKVTYPYWKVR